MVALPQVTCFFGSFVLLFVDPRLTVQHFEEGSCICSLMCLALNISKTGDKNVAFVNQTFALEDCRQYYLIDEHRERIVC